MIIVKLSNGEAHLVEVCTRKNKKEINKKIIELLPDKTNFEGFNMTQSDELSDALVLGLLKKLIIADKEVKINQEAIDKLDTRDFDLILTEVNKIITPEIPKE